MIPRTNAEPRTDDDADGTAAQCSHATGAEAEAAAAVNEEVPSNIRAIGVGDPSDRAGHIPPTDRPPSSIRRVEVFAETMLNLTLFDPPRYGWTALGGVTDLLSPHERSRRRSTCLAYRKDRRRQQRASSKKRTNSGAATIQNGQTQIQWGEGSLSVGGTRGTLSPPAATTIQSTTGDQQQQEPRQVQRQFVSSDSATCTAPPYNVRGQERDQQQERRNGNLKDPPSYSVATENHQPPQPAKSIGDLLQQGNVIVGHSTNQSAHVLSLERQQTERPLPVPPQAKKNDGDSSKPEDPLLMSLAVRQPNLTANPVREGVVQPQSPSGIDLGMKLMGVSTEILGMSIRHKLPHSNNNSNEDGIANTDNGDTELAADDPKETENCINTNTVTTNTAASSSKRRGVSTGTYECSVQALQDGILDMYAYHRGREGMEARDAESGELLCPPEVTDTNHSTDSPKLVASVTIQFFLDDEDNDGAEKKNADDKEEGRAMFREVLEWDLSDPTTPSPLTFATSIAREYGLDFGQTLNLAASIEQQIDAHIWQSTQYSEPIAIKDQKGVQERGRQPLPTRQAYRYDQVIDTGKGGFAKPRKERVIPRTGSSSDCAMNDSYMMLDTNTAAATSAATDGEKMGSTRVFLGSKGRRSIVEDSLAGDLNVSSVEVETDNEEVDDTYVAEVKKQSRAASVVDLRHKCKNGIVGKMEQMRNSHCHICHKRCEVGFSFACENASHIYCAAHITARLGISWNTSSIVTYDSCPVCSLNCTCAKCIRKLNCVAKVFKAMCISQGKQPSEVPFSDVLKMCCLHQTLLSKEVMNAEAVILRNRKKLHLEALAKQQGAAVAKQQAANAATASGKGQDSKVRRLNSLHAGVPKQGMVPKPPLNDFPREIYKGKELEVGTAEDYFTVFSAAGQQSVNEVPDAWKKEERQVESLPLLPAMDVVEDGNVDYCYMCQTHGNLFCCDVCPRAFHLECICKAGHSSPSGGRWECFICSKERIGTDDDFVDGKDSIDLICASFLDIDPNDQSAFNGLEALSRIHGMLIKLMAYDFGTLFNAPVNADAVAGYKEVVKHPMDLATICYRLINKGYSASYEEDHCMDDVVSNVLEDVELVWHNCFLFNGVGTSIYRMGEVQRRRAQMIQKRSFDHLLSEKVKDKVRAFIRGTEKARAAAIHHSPSKDSAIEARTTIGLRERAIKEMKPRGKHKITTDSFKRSPGRPIAVLDTVSGRIVRVYSTSKAAAQAVHCLRSCGHRCEWNCDAITNTNMKLIAQRCGKDPHVLLFGYRWVFLEELRSGQVAFLPPMFHIIEMRQNHCTFVFQSVEEALSSSDLPTSVELDSLRQKLAELPRNGDWTEIGGLNWRRPPVEGHESETPHVDSQNEERGMEQSRSISFVAQHPPAAAVTEKYWRNCVVVKRDLVTDRNLVGFEYLPLALKDWMQTTAASPMFPETEARTIENFKKYYLDGDRNVDGIVWRTVKPSEPLPPTKSAIGRDMMTGTVDGNSTWAHQVPVQRTETPTTVVPAAHGFSDAPVDNNAFSEMNGICTPVENPLKRKQIDGAKETTDRKEVRLSTSGNDQNEEPNNGERKIDSE